MGCIFEDDDDEDYGGDVIVVDVVWGTVLEEEGKENRVRVRKWARRFGDRDQNQDQMGKSDQHLRSMHSFHDHVCIVHPKLT
jgi:hypothetical protein